EEAVGRHDDLVTGVDPQGLQGENESDGAVGTGDAEPGVLEGCEFLFESLHVFAEPPFPAPDHVQNPALLLLSVNWPRRGRLRTDRRAAGDGKLSHGTESRLSPGDSLWGAVPTIGPEAQQEKPPVAQAF